MSKCNVASTSAASATTAIQSAEKPRKVHFRAFRKGTTEELLLIRAIAVHRPFAAKYGDKLPAWERVVAWLKEHDQQRQQEQPLQNLIFTNVTARCCQSRWETIRAAYAKTLEENADHALEPTPPTPSEEEHQQGTHGSRFRPIRPAPTRTELERAERERLVKDLYERERRVQEKRARRYYDDSDNSESSPIRRRRRAKRTATADEDSDSTLSQSRDAADDGENISLRLGGTADGSGHTASGSGSGLGTRNAAEDAEGYIALASILGCTSTKRTRTEEIETQMQAILQQNESQAMQAEQLMLQKAILEELREMRKADERRHTQLMHLIATCIKMVTEKM
ncbi:hypothetical protein BGZ54_008909 [Gamsiella multidivaricata]|nr:hypothetical protein BGZ54_008909 [Gamsiella multidivaricata]